MVLKKDRLIEVTIANKKNRNLPIKDARDRNNRLRGEMAETWHYGLVTRWWFEFNLDAPEISYFKRSFMNPVFLLWMLVVIHKD